MLKKIIVSFLFISLTVLSGLRAQQNDKRTIETKIADIVMHLPANSSADFNRLMGDLVRLGDIIPTMSAKLNEPGKGDDSQMRYAIAGMATYAGKSDKSGRKDVAQSICKALGQVKSDEVRDFLLIQLQYVAADESVAEMSKYLSNNRLCDAAARVLVNINSDASKKALFQAITSANGQNQQTLIQSLAYAKYAPALDVISPLVTNSDADVRKVAMFALANIASPTSEPVLKAAAEKVGYKFEKTDAYPSYLLLLKNLNSKGEKAIVEKAAKQMLKTVNQASAKSAVLELYIQSADEKAAIAEIIKAVDGNDKQYRMAALRYSTAIQSPNMYNALIKKAEKEKRSEVKAELISAFGVRGDKEALPFILKSIPPKGSFKPADSAVIATAMQAAAALGNEQAIAPIISVMSKSTIQSLINAGKQSLLTIINANLTADIAKAIPQSTTQSKMAFLEILGKRKATSKADIVFANADNKCTGNIANKVLKDVVSEKDVARVADLLNKVPASCTETLSDFQHALFAAVQNAGNKDNQARLVISQMEKSSNSSYYYSVLSMIGGNEALQVIEKVFDDKNVDKQVRDNAFDALTRWSDVTVAEKLYQICKTKPNGEYFDKALGSYITKVNASKTHDDQKLLLLRSALEIAKSNEHKIRAIRGIGNLNSFLAMNTAGKYIDDEALRHNAVMAVMSIALRNNNYYGKQVSDLLNKAMKLDVKSESEYRRSEILTHMAKFPNDDGYVSMFNGKDLSGWKGLVGNPISRAKMTDKQVAQNQIKADEIMRRDWKVENDVLVFEGEGYDNLCSNKEYGDFEMVLDWRIEPKGDAGVYLRGSPQVQVWDISLVEVGAQVGSGGLYNNQKNESKPLLVADNAIGEWNTFRIRMVGDKVTVYLNGQLVTDNVSLENYWDRKIPIFPKGAIELQAHGTRVEYRDIYVKEIPRIEPYEVSQQEKTEGFTPMFNGMDMNGWIGNLTSYFAENGEIVCDPKKGKNRSGGNLYTEKEYSDFVMRFDFQLTPAANSGLGIRTPLEGDAAYVGMELQILDNEAEVYKDLHEYQYHGSVYGVIKSKRGYLKPVGEWNTQEVIANGKHIKVTLNGVVILDGDIAKASKNFSETIDKIKHPGLSNKKGHIGFLGHGSYVKFKNLRIKDLTAKPAKR